VTDMGALYHDQTPAPEIQLSCNQLLFGSVAIGEQSDLPLTIYNVGDADLIIYDIYTSDPCFTTDFDPADSLILPGNDLTVTVTFAPEEAIPYIETLCVESNDDSMEVGLLGIGEEVGGIKSEPYGEIPDTYVFEGPYPNPFNPSTTFDFALPEAAYVNLTIYDASGSVVAELVDGWMYAGHYSVSFDATGMPTGIYFYRLNGGEFGSAGKLVLMK